MTKWLLLLLASTFSCQQHPITPLPNSSTYQQHEDSALAQLGGKVLGDKRSVIPYASSQVFLIPTMGYPLRLGATHASSPRAIQLKYATLEARRILKQHGLTLSFLPLLIKLWDETDAVNTVPRLVPYSILSAEIISPLTQHAHWLKSLSQLHPQLEYDKGSTNTTLSRVCFDPKFMIGVFQVIYSDPGSGIARLYFIRKHDNQWRIIAEEYVDSWKY